MSLLCNHLAFLPNHISCTILNAWQEIIKNHASDKFIFNMSRTNVVSIRFVIRRNVADSLFQVFHDVLKYNCVNEHIAASIFIEKHSL